jgi:G3E family GTPase
MKITNVSIITGFLGVGKTTLIKDLLDCKPINENWAVIVNEFGKVGVDALFYKIPVLSSNKLQVGVHTVRPSCHFKLR